MCHAMLNRLRARLQQYEFSFCISRQEVSVPQGTVLGFKKQRTKQNKTKQNKKEKKISLEEIMKDCVLLAWWYGYNFLCWFEN